MKRILPFVLLISFSIISRANDHDIDLKTLSSKYIPAPLLENADAVMRFYNYEVGVSSLDKVYSSLSYAVTILNKDGYGNAIVKEYYNSFKSIDRIELALVDKDGKELKRMSEKEMRDYPSVSDAFFSDSRYKYYDFNYGVYPFTVVVKIIMHQNCSFFLPGFSPQNNFNCSVEKASYKIDYAKGIPLRYKTFYIDNRPEERTKNEYKTLLCSVKNIPAFKPESMLSDSAYKIPHMLVATDSFMFGDLHGQMDTWQSYGKFFYDLNNKRDTLPGNIKAIVHKLTDSCKTERSKISILYKYLQQNTRYVGIQLGIGGWQCFKAADVAANGYGDCKALTNYLMSLLKEANVKSYAALVWAGEGRGLRMQEDFVCNVFDHVILVVPLKNDTVWVECTSSDLPAGYLSSFTSDRKVLVLTENGGEVVKTPGYTEKENTLSRKTVLNVSVDYTVKGEAMFFYKGMFWDNEHHKVIGESKERVENYFSNRFALPSYKINEYYITNFCEGIPALYEKISFSGDAKIAKSGNRLFITPHILSVHAYVPDEDNDGRKGAFLISSSYQINDTEVVNLNGQYTTEFIPGKSMMKYDFGEYECETIFNNNVITVLRSYKQKKGTYPKEQFKDYLAFSRAVNNEAGQKQVVLLKKQ